MTEQATPQAPAEPDTPAPTPAAPEPEVDYRERYENLRPEFTRATQTLSDEERLLEHVREKFPHWLEGEPEPEAAPTPAEPAHPQEPSGQPDPRFEESLTRVEALEQAEQQRQVEATLDAMGGDLDDILGERKLPENLRSWVFQQTLEGGKDKDAMQQVVDGLFTSWEQANPAPPKPRPRAPHQPGGTPPGEPSPAATHEERTARALARLNAETA